MMDHNKAEYSLWHKRMGHLNETSLKSLCNKQFISVTNWKRSMSVCSSCQMSKSCKLPFTSTNKISIFPIDKVHCDLWGPAPILSCQNFKYYVSFVDDHSRFTWIFPLKTKSDFLLCFVKFKKNVENQLERRIKILQTDGGGEFISSNLKTLLEQSGIQHQISCPHTPQQNGVVERKYRHVVETGLTLLFQSNEPMKYWVDAFLTATFLMNRMPSSVHYMDTPFENFFIKNLFTI